MEFREFHAHEHEPVREALGVRNAATLVDSPWQSVLPLNRFALAVEHGWDGEPNRWYLARDGSTPVGAASINIGTYDNTQLAWVQLCIHPEHRHQGHGSEMLRRLLQEVRDAGCHTMVVDAWESDAAAAFAARHGFEAASVSVNRRMFLDDETRATVDRMYDEAAPYAEDYELLHLVGPTPPELLEAVADLTGAINDAPMDDLDFEDEQYPPERVHTYEQTMVDTGWRFYRVLARHRGTGELGGHTVVVVDGERPSEAEQHDTAVRPAHRGHRLGLLLKAEMVRWMAEVEPQITSVDTWNAESNTHMVGVNELLGYQVLGREVQYQRSLRAHDKQT